MAPSFEPTVEPTPNQTNVENTVDTAVETTVGTTQTVEAVETTDNGFSTTISIGIGNDESIGCKKNLLDNLWGLILLFNFFYVCVFD